MKTFHFFLTSSLTSQRFLQKSKEIESLENRSDLQSLVLFNLKELRVFQENMESFHEVES